MLPRMPLPYPKVGRFEPNSKFFSGPAQRKLDHLAVQILKG